MTDRMESVDTPDILDLAQFLCSDIALEPWDEISRPKYVADAKLIMEFLATSPAAAQSNGGAEIVEKAIDVLINESDAEIAGLRTRLEATRKALEPFAAVARVMDFYIEESMPEMTYPRPECESKYPDEPRCVSLSSEDFAAALAALTIG